MHVFVQEDIAVIDRPELRNCAVAQAWLPVSGLIAIMPDPSGASAELLHCPMG
jgi:hypothetical protein